MPRPPILAVLDWRSFFDQCHDWSSWIESADSAEQARRMERVLERQSFEPDHAERIDIASSEHPR